jgi:C-5 cytosine-specific DNA methylase
LTWLAIVAASRELLRFAGNLPRERERERGTSCRFRILKPRELIRAQGFPDEYVFTGNREAVVKQIGKAVPLIPLGADQRGAGVNAYATFLLRFAKKSKRSFSAKARLCSAALTSSLSSSYLQEISIISSSALWTFVFSSFNFSFRVTMAASDQWLSDVRVDARFSAEVIA